ncbi:DUF2867 domain-containing protein [Novispirillum sp. DQ9]|uniref:DUF2867 domain-containing protein n=1 Tax=Novispirillum sp. DQ9 TaxID=3398612 RepID=UPI003C7CD49E
MRRTTDYQDSLTISLTCPPPPMEAVITAFFQGAPRWLDALMALRNALVRPLGLKTGPVGPEALKPPFAVGGAIGLFRIVALTEREVVLGEDDRHLDFRVTLRVARQDLGASVDVETWVRPHNRLGRWYLALVLPVHRHIVPVVAANMARRLEALAVA